MRKKVSPFSRASGARTCSDRLGFTELRRKGSPVRRVNLNVFRNLKTERTRIHFFMRPFAVVAVLVLRSGP